MGVLCAFANSPEGGSVIMDEGLVARDGGRGDRRTSYRLSVGDEGGA